MKTKQAVNYKPIKGVEDFIEFEVKAGDHINFDNGLKGKVVYISRDLDNKIDGFCLLGDDNHHSFKFQVIYDYEGYAYFSLPDKRRLN